MIFLYYLPGATEATAKEHPAFRAGGLQVVFRDCGEDLAFAESKGPDGQTGLLLYALGNNREKPFALRYRPDDQTWIDCGTHWIGIHNANPPQPEGLQRKKTLDSYNYTLADGREWLCPKIRRGGVPLLPAYWKLNRGTFSLEVKPEFVDVWEASADWALDVRTMLLPEAFAICAMCLGLNYRIGVDELSAMNVLDTEASREVILAALDEQFFLDLVNQKKTLGIATLEESEN